MDDDVDELIMTNENVARRMSQLALNIKKGASDAYLSDLFNKTNIALLDEIKKDERLIQLSCSYRGVACRHDSMDDKSFSSETTSRVRQRGHAHVHHDQCSHAPAGHRPHSYHHHHHHQGVPEKRSRPDPSFEKEFSPPPAPYEKASRARCYAPCCGEEGVERPAKRRHSEGCCQTAPQSHLWEV